VLLHIAVIVMTYRRPTGLHRALSSVIASADFSMKKCRTSVHVYDNDPESQNAELIRGIGDHRIRYSRRTRNIGPRQNFVDALVETFQLVNADAYVYVSDDDIVLPDFLSICIARIVDGNDAVITSCFVAHEPSERLRGYGEHKHTARIVPTRPSHKKNIRLQFIVDSRLLTGTVYAKRLVMRVLDNGPEMLKYASTLWYPMAFFASYSDNPAFITTPIFVHTQENKTYWGKIDYYQEFFLDRIAMYEKMMRIGNIQYKDYKALISDFVGHQSARRILKYLSRDRKFLPRIFLVMTKKLFGQTIGKAALYISKKMYLNLSYLRKI